MERLISYKDIELNCVFSIDPFVEEVLWGDDAHPSEGGVIYDLEIFLEGVEISEILSEKHIDSIKDQIYDMI